MRKLILFAALLLHLSGYSQDIKSVSIVVSGQGKTQEEAKQQALRSAIEQAFGTFISAKTEILNDSLVQDQIVSISKGNIKSFEVLSSLVLPDNQVQLVTLRAIVSLDKLASFVQSKGYNDIAFDGGGFAVNLKMQKLNETSEKVAIYNLLSQGLSISRDFFDRELTVGSPKLLSQDNSENTKYQIPLKVQTKLNSNWHSYFEYFQKTLKSIGMSAQDIAFYRELNKRACDYVFVDKTTVSKQVAPNRTLYDERFSPKDTVYLRSQESFALISAFYSVLNIVYLDGICIIHDLDTVNLDMERIFTDSNVKYKIWRGKLFPNTWDFDFLPFNLSSTYNKYADTPESLYRALLELFENLKPVKRDDFFFAERSIDDRKFESALYKTKTGVDLGEIAKLILDEQTSHPFFWDVKNKKTLYHISEIGENRLNVSINLSFSEGELDRIKGFKLVKASK
jgi:hypothetical protein